MFPMILVLAQDEKKHTNGSLLYLAISRFIEAVQIHVCTEEELLCFRFIVL